MKASRSNHVKLDPVVPEMRYSFCHFKFLAEWEKNLADSPKLFVRTFLICRLRGLRTTNTAFCAYDRKKSARVLTLAHAGCTATETKAKQPVNGTAHWWPAQQLFFSLSSLSRPLLHPQRWYLHSRPFLSLSPPIQLRPGRRKCMISRFDWVQFLCAYT